MFLVCVCCVCLLLFVFVVVGVVVGFFQKGCSKFCLVEAVTQSFACDLTVSEDRFVQLGGRGDANAEYSSPTNFDEALEEELGKACAPCSIAEIPDTCSTVGR